MGTVKVNPVKSTCMYPQMHVIKKLRDVLIEIGLYFIKNHCPFALFCTRLWLALLPLAAVRLVAEEAIIMGKSGIGPFHCPAKVCFLLKVHLNLILLLQ